MKLRSTRPPYETFDAELTTTHPDGVPGRLDLMRVDNGAFIALKDCFGVAGMPLPSKLYDVLAASEQEKKQLDQADILIL